MPKRRSIGRNALGSVIGNLGYFGVQVLITPIALAHLGAEGWGIWQLVGATAIYAQLLNLSLGTAVHYQVALRMASGDLASLGAAVANVRLYLLLAGLLLLALLALGGRAFVVALVAPEQRTLAWSALAISVTLTALDFQTRFYGSVLGGLQRLDLHGAIQLASGAALLAGVVIGFARGMDLRGFAALMTAAPILQGASAALTLRRILPAGTLRAGKPDFALFRNMAAYSTSTILYSAGAVVLYQTMKFIASLRCGGPAAAGHIGVATSVAQMVAVVFAPPAGAILARVSQLKGGGRIAEASALLERTATILALMIVPAAVFIALDAERILTVWVGHTEAASALPAMARSTRLLVLGTAGFALGLPFYNALLGIGEHRAFGLGMLGAALANTLLAWFATGISPRIETLAAVYAAVTLALVLLVTVPHTARRFGLGLARLGLRVAVVPALVAAPGAAALSWIARGDVTLPLLARDAVVFSLAALPGLELARRWLRLTISPKAFA
jgi:O-antigen/teichoic acid export membrane protein